MERLSRVGKFAVLSGALCVIGCGGGGAEPLPYVPPSCSASRAPFGGGDGSQDSPYTICTAEHLNAVSGALSSAFLVTEEIDLSDLETFSIIGSEEEPFVGHFHGARLAIRGLRLDFNEDETLENQVGFFGVIGEEGVVRNVTLEDVEVVAAQYVGALAGVNQGEISGARVSGVVAEVGRQSLPGKSVGGLVGLNQGQISDSRSSASVHGYEETGGLVGTNEGLIANSRGTGAVRAQRSYAGGLVGLNTGRIQGSRTTADVIAGVSPASGSGRAANAGESHFIGGLVGLNEGEVRRSQSEGTVTGSGGGTGGLVGVNRGEVSDSSAEVEVVSLSPTERQFISRGENEYRSGDFAAGLVGRNEGLVKESHATGDVVSGGWDAAGLVGYNAGEIHTCYATGNVQGPATIGGLVGSNRNEIIRSFAEGDVEHPASLAPSEYHGRSIGGLAASNSGVIEDSFSRSAVTSRGANAGGFVGFTDGVIKTSRAYGDVTNLDGSTPGLAQIHATGGFAGVNLGELTECHASGDVHGEGESSGGLVGFGDRMATISRSSAQGRVRGTSDNTGGLVGYKLSGVIERSYALGDVETGVNAGGLVGFASFFGDDTVVIRDSFALGSVDGYAAGGLVGKCASRTRITRSFATGALDWGWSHGGLVGEANADPWTSERCTATHSFWDIHTSGVTTNNGIGAPLTTEAFAEESSFPTWNFETVWEIGEAADGVMRPVLRPSE